LTTLQSLGAAVKYLTSLCGRRFAAGIDIHADSVRAVAMSRALSGNDMPCVEHIGLAELPLHAMHGSQIADPALVSAAIVQALGAFYTPRSAASLRVVMALAPAACLITTIPYSQLPLVTQPRWASYGPEAWRLDLLEPGVRAHAEALAGIEGDALALDWWHGRTPWGDPDHLNFAAATREHIDARIDAAAGAGLQLVAIEVESSAALRACRYDAQREMPADAPYVVLWVGEDNLHLWIVRDARPVRELQAPMQPDIATGWHQLLARYTRFMLSETDSLSFVGTPPLPTRSAPNAVFVAGDLQRLLEAGFALEDIGAALRCQVFEFDAGCQCDGRPPVVLPETRPAALAVAFGLALRGVWQ